MERAQAEQTSSEPASAAPQASPAAPAVLQQGLTPAAALALQRAIGNRNVVRIARQPKTAPPPIRPVVEGFDDVVDLHRRRAELPHGRAADLGGHQGDGPRERDGQARAGADRGGQELRRVAHRRWRQGDQRDLHRGCARGARRDPHDAQRYRVGEGGTEARARSGGPPRRPRGWRRSTRSSSRSCSTPHARRSATTTTRSRGSPTSSTRAAPSSTSAWASSRCRATSAARS